jgi:hypothetical protein
MKVLIESIITLVDNENLESAAARTTKYAENKIKDDTFSFVLDTQDIFDIAKKSGLETANKSIDKVLSNFSNELKSRLSKVINN